ncbi:MAG: hypothetical protein ACXAD7_01820 [Candidatus Kariarchaeaceae archaeon]
MDKPEKSPIKKAKKVDKSIAEDSVEKQSMDMSLGDELLEREFRRNQAVRELLAKHKSEEED